MGGKKGGGARTPYIAPNTLESKQKIKLVHLLSAGVMSGWQNEELLKSIKFNDTYVQNADGTFNFNNVQASYLSGDLDQDYLPGFDGIERTVSVGAQVKKNTPVTRTITDPLVGALRVTLGVPALFRQTDQGDMYGTHVDISVQIIKNNNIYTSKLWSLNEKGNSNFKEDVVIDDLPEAPFDLKIVRITADSNDDRLKNDTFFHSYVEIVPQKFSYPTCAVVGLELDAEQLGGQVPTVNYDVKGREIQVPSNYDPVNRTYAGLWDGSFKTAFSNNPAWVLYDLLTDEIHGMGRHFNESIIDKMKLYEIGKYADELVDDGEGGKEPRYVFNGLIQGNDAMTVIDNVCSVFRGRAVEKNGFISFIYDKGNQAPVATYTNANVVDGLFRYTHAPLDTRVNSIHFEYADERDGCKLKVEEVSDQASIAQLGRINTQKITCYGQTKRSSALRQATWFLQTSATESESVTFAVGFEGIKHGAFDIIAIADNHKAGVPIGGRITAVDGNKVTLDRDVFDAKEIRIRSTLYKVVSQLESNVYRLDKAVLEPVYSVFSANTEKATERLFKVISTEENEDGSYTVSAVKYNAQKMGNVDDSISDYPEITTSYNTVPVLDGASVSNQGDYILLTWDSLSSSGVDIEYTIQLFKDQEIYRTYTSRENSLKLYDLPMGEYEARIKGRTSAGIYSKELVIVFSTTYIIQNLTYKPIVFGFELAWQNPPLITKNAKIEVWCSDEDKADTYRKFATVAYPQSTHTIGNLSAGDELYCKVRIVDDKLNYGEFTTPVLAKASTNADDMLSYLQGKITTKELDSDVVDQLIQEVKDDIDFNDILTQEDLDALIDQIISDINTDEIIDGAVEKIKDNVDEIIAESEIVGGINEKVENAEIDTRLLELSKATSDRAVYSETQVNRVSIDDNYAEMILQKVTEATNNKQLASQYLSLVAENEIARAEFMLSQIAETTNNKALAQEILTLTASFLDNEAQLQEFREVYATDKEAVARSIDKLESDVDGNRAEISVIHQTISDLDSATSSSIEDLHSEIDSVDGKLTADVRLSKLSSVTGDSQLAGQQLSLIAQRDDDIASFKLSQIAKTTSDKSLANQILSINSTFNDNKAQIEEVRQTVAENDKATATAINNLKTDVEGNKSEINVVKQSVSTLENSTATSIEELKADVAGNKSEITDVKRVQSNDRESFTQQLNSASSEWKSANEVKYLTSSDVEKTPREYADLYGKTTVTEFGTRSQFGLSSGTYHTVTTTISFLSGLDRGRVTQRAVSNDFAVAVRERKSISDDAWSSWVEIEDVAGAQKKADEAQKEAVRISKASIDSLAQTQANDKQALARDISRVQASVDDTNAKVTQNSTAIANVDGTVKSQYTLTTEAISGGQRTVSGFTSINDGKTSEFIIQADKFAIVNKRNGETRTPFVVVDNKLGMDGDIIASGSISGNKITAGTSIQAPIIKGGRVESGHFAGGSINIGNGNFNVDSNGNLYARSGKFEGTVYAEKIEGEIASITSFDGMTVTFSRRNERAILTYTLLPERFDRVLVETTYLKVTSTNDSYNSMWVDQYIGENVERVLTVTGWFEREIYGGAFIDIPAGNIFKLVVTLRHGSANAIPNPYTVTPWRFLLVQASSKDNSDFSINKVV